MHKYVNQEHHKKASIQSILTGGAAPLTDDNIQRVSKIRNIDTPSWHKFLLLVCFSDSWNGFWQLRVMLAEYEGQLSVGLVLFGENSRLHGVYSFPPQCGVSFSRQSNARNIHQNPSNMRCMSWQNPACTAFHSTLLCVSHLIVFPSFTSTPHIFAAVNIRPPSVW